MAAAEARVKTMKTESTVEEYILDQRVAVKLVKSRTEL